MKQGVIKHRYYVIILLLLTGGLVLLGLSIQAGSSYWIWSAAAVVLYIWCKDALTGKGWFDKPVKQKVQEPTPFQKQMARMSYEEFTVALPYISDREKEGYIELTKLCVAAEKQPALIRFFETLKDFSQDDDYGTNLNYVMEYLNGKDIAFIILIGGKAPVEELVLSLTKSLQENFAMTIQLPDAKSYGERAAVSFAPVLTDFDKPLRKHALQLGFIDTESDEYVIVVHKTEDRQQAEESVRKIGYKYYEVQSKL